MPKITKEAKNRGIDLLAEIQSDRQIKEQELGWLFRPLVVCPFPAYSPGKRTVKDVFGKEKEEYHVLWERRSGNIRVKVLGDPEYGIPHGQDTLIILYLAFEARRQGSRKIKVDFYRDFMKMFQMNPNDGRKYRLVVESLRRIRNSKYSWDVEGENRERGVNFLYIDEYDLFCDPKNPDQRSLFDQYILLSERFWEEIRSHRIPSNLKAIIALKAKPAHLNFYVWLSYRVGQAYRETIEKGQGPEAIPPIPFWGPTGLQEQMSSKIEQKFLYRNEVKKWMKSVKEVWPLCPVEMVDDSLRINVTSADQLDVLPKDTDAPRILPTPKPLLPPKPPTDDCPQCGKARTLKTGKISTKGYRMPDYWECAGGCGRTAAQAKCKHCGQTMEERNKGKADYSYFCSKCQHYEGGEAYWLKYSVFV